MPRSAPATSSSSTPTTSASTSSSPTRSSASASSTPRCARSSSRAGKERIFCAGANIYMLASSTHPFKVNFCKFTNETRLSLEDASRATRASAPSPRCNGPAAGGGYELALACDEILLVDDGIVGGVAARGAAARRAARHRRAHARRRQAQGAPRSAPTCSRRSPRASRASAPSSGGSSTAWRRARSSPTPVRERAPAAGGRVDGASGRGRGAAAARARRVDRRRPLPATSSWPSIARGARRRSPCAAPTPTSPASTPSSPRGSELVAAARLPRARRRAPAPALQPRGDRPRAGQDARRSRARCSPCDAALDARRDDWFVREIVLHMARVLQRLDMTARSLFAVVEPESCFAGSLLELALAADRRYMLDDAKRPVHVQASELNGGLLPMANGLSRLGACCGIEEELPGICEQARSTPARPTRRASSPCSPTTSTGTTSCASRSRSARRSRPTRSPAWRRRSASPGRRRWRPRSSAASRRGRTGSSSGRTRSASAARSSLYGKPERPSFDWRRT